MVDFCEILYIFVHGWYNGGKENNMVTTYADIHVKVNKEVKEESEKILSSIGISMSDLINMTLRRVVYERQIPFSTRLEWDEVPDSLKVNTREELDKLLDQLSTEEENEMLSSDEMWGSMREYIREVEMRRGAHAKV